MLIEISSEKIAASLGGAALVLTLASCGSGDPGSPITGCYYVRESDWSVGRGSQIQCDGTPTPVPSATPDSQD